MNTFRKGFLGLVVSVGLAGILAACGGITPEVESDVQPETEAAQNLTPQAFTSCSAVPGYSTYITYNAGALIVCRKSTPPPMGSSYVIPGKGTAPVINPTHAYIVIARMGTSTSTSKVAAVRHYYNRLESTTNPLMDKRSAANWFETASVNFSDAQIVINGAFYERTEPFAESRTSFPIYFGNSLVTTGNNAVGDNNIVNAVPDNQERRALCFDSAAAQAFTKAWTLNSTNSTTTNIANGQVGCPNLFVSFSPTLREQNGDPRSPYTFVGLRNSFSVNTADTMCFYVGGYQTRAQARADLTGFGCTPALELDGGNSSSMSLRTSSGRLDPVRSWEQPLGGDRGVPHVFLIRF